ncbi:MULTISPECIES: TonB-dependent siderophore receptor [Enterobacter]|jgi:iron complex outermembrane receptor protein|uniref:TonB-dependent siderophore receptor n=1 Tax=Enterobacter bugandensis TaxID=881260 RepID=A0ABX4VLS9_9ENTR|nr:MULTISPECIES: TonB-dependent siderophore receptor [Enterobacter]MBW4192713.1 TonB-dependent siderophore receptor [Enterobacter bugandensis]MBZ6366913.1 TonB-dependent siderophore receptor [Enterobacter bugandensis]MCK6759948.1 TonB-dependent siderophore receptor [Enterobacter bugandensis]MCK6833102.1 TonB-dependent siderophore receptor [Enterobacter bugandensis]NUX26681.1 TonB-dependent siderophore receptor [Enterobacter bugandensis]
MATFTPSLSGIKGRALFSLLFMAPLSQAADTTAKDGETLTVTADPNATADATNGYQPLNTSTATLTNMPMLDIPQVVNTVSDKVLADQHATTLDEALYNVSNVVQTNTLGGTQDAFVRRGFGANRDGSIMTNGLRTVLPRSFNAATERVEVLKGPASTLYGILDPGGLINVVTKRPEKIFGGSISATSSSFGGGTGQVDVTGPIEGTRLAYRLTGEYQDEDYWRNFGNERSTFIAPSLTWFGDDATVTVLYSHRDYKTPFDRGTIFDLNTKKAVDVDRKTRFDEPFNVTDGQSDLAQLNAEYRLNSQWTAKFDYSYSQDKYSDNQARVMAYDSKTGTLTRRVDATQGSTQRMHSTRADLQGNVDIAGFYNEILTGVSYENYDLLRTDMMRCKNVKGFNIYNPVYGKLDECTTVSAADSDQTLKQESYSAYAQDALYLTDKWIAVAGLRYQYYTQYAGKGRPFNVNTDSRDEQWTPKLGLVYKLTPAVSLFANYSQTFMPQSSIASYIGDLPPETSNAYEVGAKFDLFDGITANIALFDIHKRNVLYTESIGGETIAKTAGRVRSQGVEVDLAGSLTENTNIIASYGYTDAKVLEDPDYAGKPLPNVPRHTGSLFLTYDIHNAFAGNTLTLGGGGHGVSRRSATNGADYYLPGYFVADAFAAYKMKLQYPVTLQVNVKNLFDKTYYTSSIATNNLGNQIGDPREVQFTVKMEF